MSLIGAFPIEVRDILQQTLELVSKVGLGSPLLVGISVNHHSTIRICSTQGKTLSTQLALASVPSIPAYPSTSQTPTESASASLSLFSSRSPQPLQAPAPAPLLPPLSAPPPHPAQRVQAPTQTSPAAYCQGFAATGPSAQTRPGLPWAPRSSGASGTRRS